MLTIYDEFADAVAVPSKRVTVHRSPAPPVDRHGHGHGLEGWDMSTRPHGYARYRLDGCRCYTCAYTRSVYDERRAKAITAGTWRPWADAGPVRDHIRLLQSCGMGLRTIARLADVDRKRLQAITSGRPDRGTGPQERVRPALAASVLAVEPTLDTIAPHTPIDATGTRRRLQALVTGGWAQHHLAVRLAMSPGNFATMLKRQQVTVATARAVRDVYDELCLADPADHGVSPVGITRARRYATARRWAPVGAWDEETIDDPVAHPDWTGQCGTPQGYRAHRRAGTPTCDRCRAAKRTADQARPVVHR